MCLVLKQHYVLCYYITIILFPLMNNVGDILISSQKYLDLKCSFDKSASKYWFLLLKNAPMLRHHTEHDRDLSKANTTKAACVELLLNMWHLAPFSWWTACISVTSTLNEERWDCLRVSSASKSRKALRVSISLDGCRTEGEQKGWYITWANQVITR